MRGAGGTVGRKPAGPTGMISVPGRGGDRIGRTFGRKAAGRRSLNSVSFRDRADAGTGRGRGTTAGLRGGRAAFGRPVAFCPVGAGRGGVLHFVDTVAVRPGGCRFHSAWTETTETGAGPVGERRCPPSGANPTHHRTPHRAVGTAPTRRRRNCVCCGRRGPFRARRGRGCCDRRGRRPSTCRSDSPSWTSRVRRCPPPGLRSFRPSVPRTFRLRDGGAFAARHPRTPTHFRQPHPTRERA